MKTNFTKKSTKAIALFVGFILWLMGSACNEKAENGKIQPLKKLQPGSAIIKKPGSTFTDTLVIAGRSAVFYSPDSQQLKKIIAVNQTQTYAMIAHDCHYQMQNARLVLQHQWPGIKVYETTRARFLLFIKNDKTTRTIDLNDKNDICGLFLFDGKKEPVLADMPNIATVLAFYFNK